MKRRVNWWLGAIIIFALVSVPWLFSLILLVAGVWLFEGFIVALPLALLADFAYGASGVGWGQFPFWFTALVLLAILAKHFAGRLLIFRS